MSSIMFMPNTDLYLQIECNETDAWLSMELMFHLSILPLTRQLTNISGNLWGKTLQVGAQMTSYTVHFLVSFLRMKFMCIVNLFSGS